MRWILVAVLSFCCLIPIKAEALPKSTQALTKHLESLGYTCTVDTKNKTELVKASHERYLNMMFYEAGKGIAFSALFHVKPEYKDNPMPILQKINQLSDFGIWLPKVSLYEDPEQKLTLHMQAWLPDVYQRDLFNDFMSRWHQDTLAAGQLMQGFLEAP